MFLVDTNIVSELIRPRPNLPLVRRLPSTDPARLFASEITRYELRFGAAIHPRSDEIWGKVEREIVPLVLVTRNLRHFQNVPGLTVVSWFSEE